MDYLQKLKEQPPNKTAFIMEGRHYTYDFLVQAALTARTSLLPSKSRTIKIIDETSLVMQLIRFLAYSGTNRIPLLIPATKDTPSEADLSAIDIPDEVCMGVLTSGTTGTAKVLFRSFRSWFDFFPVQHQIFKTGFNSRLFLQGSLAFTGNLNLLLAQLTAGGCVVTAGRVHAGEWLNLINAEQVDTVYLIPAKLRLLQREMARKDAAPNSTMRMVISGSQSLGRGDVARLKRFWPKTTVILYYGASELNYVTYVSDREMNDRPELIGKPFPGVQVALRNGEILVNTPYGVDGVAGFWGSGDYGHMDENGNLYFDGRRDDRYKIKGMNVSAGKIEQALLDAEGIREAAVVKCEDQGMDYIQAFVVSDLKLDTCQLRKYLLDKLELWEVPHVIKQVKEFKKNASGKIIKAGLHDLD